jgi:DNA-binding response OmpR family regulator
MVPSAILIVDDEPNISYALAMVLEDEGHQVHTARNGAEALTLLEQQAVDLILSDVMMPVIDGHKLVEELRRRGDRTPIMLMSAATHAVRSIPGVPFLPKPFDIDDLLARVTRALADGQADSGSGR